MGVKNGDRVRVLYVTKLHDGTVVESSKEHGDFLEFTVGNQEIIVGFEEGVIGMEEGDEREFTVSPEKGYGQWNKEYTQVVARTQLPNEQIGPGTSLTITTSDGTKVPARVMDVNSDAVTIDLNHPLAGKELVFYVRLREIIAPTE